MKNLITKTLIICLICLSGCKENIYRELISYEENEQPILIQGVDIFTGKDDVLLKGYDVLLKNGIIESISVAAERSDQEKYKVIDGKGKTLMPGMIDSHVHLSGSGSVPWNNYKADLEYNLSAYLYAGVTTVYDLGGLASDIQSIADDVSSGKTMGPNVYHTHIPITVKNGHPIPLSEEILPWPINSMLNSISPIIDSPEEAEKLIKNYTSKGVDYVKVICDQIPPGSPEITFAQLKAVVDAAHAKGYKVFVHIGSPENAVNAVKAGADILAHGIWRGKLTPEQADIIAESKIPVIYTLAAFHNVHAINNKAYTPNDLDEELVPKEILDPVTGEKGKDVEQMSAMRAFFADVSDKNQFLLDNFDLLKARKVPILVGTDSSLPGTYAGSTYHQEIESLKNYGMSNYDILMGATSRAAQVFLENPSFGTVEKGKVADLLLLTGNPLEDISTLKSPNLIIKGGKMVKKLR